MKTNCPNCLDNQDFHIMETHVIWYIFNEQYSCKKCNWIGFEDDLISIEEVMNYYDTKDVVVFFDGLYKN